MVGTGLVEAILVGVLFWQSSLSFHSIVSILFLLQGAEHLRRKLAVDELATFVTVQLTM